MELVGVNQVGRESIVHKVNNTVTLFHVYVLLVSAVIFCCITKV